MNAAERLNQGARLAWIEQERVRLKIGDLCRGYWALLRQDTRKLLCAQILEFLVADGSNSNFIPQNQDQNPEADDQEGRYRK